MNLDSYDLIMHLESLDAVEYNAYSSHYFYYGCFIILGFVSLVFMYLFLVKAEYDCNEYNEEMLKADKREKILSQSSYIFSMYERKSLLISFSVFMLPLMISIYFIYGKKEEFTRDYNIQKAQEKQKIIGELKKINITQNYDLLPVRDIIVLSYYENVAAKASSIQIKNSSMTLDGETVDCKMNIPYDTKLMQLNGFSINQLETVYKDIKSEPLIYFGNSWAIHKTMLGYIPNDQFLNFLSSCYNQYNKKIHEKQQEKQNSIRTYYNNSREWGNYFDKK